MISKFSGIRKGSSLDEDIVKADLLIQKVKNNQKKEKRTNIFYAIGAIIFIVASGLVLAL